MKIKKRIIEIEVNDEYIVGSGVVIGAAGSHNDVIMKARFNRSWVGLNIIATFRDALGENPISVVLTALSTLVADESDHCIHKFSVPLKAKAYEGKISLSFTGYTVAAVASEDREGVEYQETQAITSGTAYFNVLKSDAMLANDVFESANVGEQLHTDVETLEGMYGDLSAALTVIEDIRDNLGDTTITVANLGELNDAIKGINDFLEYKHSEEQGKANIFDRVYPVGSIYMSVENTSPAELFGGEWIRLTDKFLLGASDPYSEKPTYCGGDEGGSEKVTLSEGEMPTHTHTQKIGLTNTEAQAMVTAKGGGSASGYAVTYANTTHISATGTNVNTFTRGGGKPHDNMPPYLAVYMWKRTALEEII